MCDAPVTLTEPRLLSTCKYPSSPRRLAPIWAAMERSESFRANEDQTDSSPPMKASDSQEHGGKTRKWKQLAPPRRRRGRSLSSRDAFPLHTSLGPLGRSAMACSEEQISRRKQTATEEGSASCWWIGDAELHAEQQSAAARLGERQAKFIPLSRPAGVSCQVSDAHTCRSVWSLFPHPASADTRDAQFCRLKANEFNQAAGDGGATSMTTRN